MSNEIILKILGASILLLLTILFAFILKISRFKNQQEKTTLQSQFAQEIFKSRIEVQNATLQQIGQELHDNIGQLLSVAKINLNIPKESIQEAENQEYIKQTNDIISQSINDLRSLTKSLDSDFVKHFQKMNVKSRVGMVLEAIRLKIVEL